MAGIVALTFFTLGQRPPPSTATMPDEGLQVCKNVLRATQMGSAVVDEARGWAQELVRRECRGPGDLDNAMRRVGQRYGLPFRTLWALRYRPPKDLLTSIYFDLRAAYEAEQERQIRLAEHELAITAAKAGTASAAYRTAVALLGKTQEVDNG